MWEEGGQILNLAPKFPLLPVRLGIWEGLRTPTSSKDPCGRKRIPPVSTFLLIQPLWNRNTLDLLIGEGRCVLSLRPAKSTSDHHWSIGMSVLLASGKSIFLLMGALLTFSSAAQALKATSWQEKRWNLTQAFAPGNHSEIQGWVFSSEAQKHWDQGT